MNLLPPKPPIQIRRTPTFELPLKLKMGGDAFWAEGLKGKGMVDAQRSAQDARPYLGGVGGRKRVLRMWASIFFLMLVFCTLEAMAGPTSNGVQLNVSVGDLNAPKELSTSLQLLLLFTVLTLAPSIVIMMTSFTRIVVVLSFLRSALGIQQPSSQILVGLSLFLTAFIMYPVWTQIDREAITPMKEKKMESSEALQKAVVPLKNFMLKYTREKDLDLFLSMMPLEKDVKAEALRSDPPVQVVIPAFMISELRTAFQMGFVIFLPFLVIDMVVSSILMAMGMMMLPPAMVTLPLKILVFVLADGWGLIVRSLVLSFQ